jgi:O-antigen/teichoic acid export membrane protein
VLLLSGLRLGVALMLVLALPLLLIPDLLIRAWLHTPGYGGGYSVMAILAGVLLIHQPIYVLTQFLIARGLQRPIAVASIVTTAVNLALSFALAWTVGIWGVALSTLVTDLAMLLWVVPRMGAPAAETSSWRVYAAMVRPAVPAFAAAALVLVAVARSTSPSSLVTLVPLGALWAVAAAGVLWQFGLAPDERLRLRRQFLTRRPATA